MHLIPFYVLRKDWGHTIRFSDIYPFRNLFPTKDDDIEVEEILEWIDANSQATRISYDTWKFLTKDDADQFLMIYNIRWA
jgi:hypothetical protein